MRLFQHNCPHMLEGVCIECYGAHIQEIKDHFINVIASFSLKLKGSLLGAINDILSHPNYAAILLCKYKSELLIVAPLFGDDIRCCHTENDVATFQSYIDDFVSGKVRIIALAPAELVVGINLIRKDNKPTLVTASYLFDEEDPVKPQAEGRVLRMGATSKNISLL